MKSYAQHGDDLKIIEILGKEKKSYLDIGAHDPHYISNTALLYELGWRGVNVEANLNLMDSFKINRPDDINVCIGVGPSRGTFDFHMYDWRSGRNTFSSDEVERVKADMWPIAKVEKIIVVTINDIVRDWCGGVWPDLLTIDIEGWDYSVIQSAAFLSDNRPQLIVVETRQHDTGKMVGLMESEGYELNCRMGENLFFT